MNGNLKSLTNFPPQNNVISLISKCYEDDTTVSEFFQLVQQTENVNDHYIEQNSSQNNKFFPDKANISQLKRYPPEIIESFSHAQNRIFVGYFPLIDQMYCCVDNKLFLWDPNKIQNLQQIEENSGNITAVEITFPNPKVYQKENVKFILIYSTEKQIVILPIDNNLDVVFDNFDENSIILQTSGFMVTSITASKSPNDYSIFVGTNKGKVLPLSYRIRDIDYVREAFFIVVKSRIVQEISSLLNLVSLQFLNSSNPIVKMSFDETTMYLAALDNKSNLKFYIYKDGALNLVSTITKDNYTSQIYNPENFQIVSLNSIPISDSSFCRFVAFTQDGTRIFFGSNPGVFSKNEEIRILKELTLPNDVRQNINLIGGFYNLNTSVMLTTDQVLILKPYYCPHQSSLHPDEYFQVFDLEEHPLNFVLNTHLFSDCNVLIFYHEIMWQHITDAPKGYLACVEGYYQFHFDRPVDTLNQLIDESQGNFTLPIKNWMSFYDYQEESSASLLLLASEYPKQKKRALFILTQYYKTKEKTAFYAFVLRASRLLSLLWYSSVFTKKENQKWKLSPIFIQIPSSLQQELETLLQLSRSYIKSRMSSSEQKNIEQQNLISQEVELIQVLNSYITSVIDILKFIKILINQKVNISDAISKISPSSQKRLGEEPFGTNEISVQNSITQSGDGVKNLSIFHALREFAAALLQNQNIESQNAHLKKIFESQCPNFFSEADLQIIDVSNRLRNAPVNSTFPPITLLNEAREIFLKNISQPFKLEDIVELFKKHKYWRGIIDVCLKRAAAIDPMLLAVQWYKGNRYKTDITGCTAFDKRYECYKCCFDIINNKKALEMMISSTDELFHICLYKKLMDDGKNELLLSLSTPHLKQFLKENAPDQLWLYYCKHEDYAESATKLYELATDETKEYQLEDRIEWIKKVISLSRASGLDELQQNAKCLLKYANVQKIINQRVQTLQNNKLEKVQNLFNISCSNGFWDLSLLIVNCTPIANEDRGKLISKLWTNFIEEQIWNDHLSVASQKISSLLLEIESESDITNPNIIMPILEEHKFRKNGAELWAVQTMLKSNINPNYILNSYLDALNNENLTKSIRCEFIYCIAYLVNEGAEPKNKNLKEIKDFFIKNGREFRYYNDAFKLINKL